MRLYSLALFLITFSLLGQSSTKTCETLSKINALIQREHFRPKSVDDSLSVYVFDAFMDDLDGNRNLFTKLEYEDLTKHRLSLDNYILENNCSFLNDFVTAYQKALERKKKVLQKLQKEDFDYKSLDTVKFSKKNFPFSLVATDIEKVWKKRLKYDILEDISKMSSNFDSLKPYFSKLEKTAKAKILETNLCKVNSILNSSKGLEYELQNDFLTIFCSYFDPHTNYFSIDARASFMSSLSTSGLSLGLTITMNEKEDLIVKEIIPGGPAAKSKKFDKNDVILKISNKQGEDYLVSCTSMDKIGELLFSDSNPEIELTIQKKNGEVVSVLLTKQLMKTTDNNVYSFVAEKEIKVGYINIPSFYSDFDGNTNKGCAYDVAIELAKLSKDAINGLVVDLQDNGGGSMEEAVKLAGLFVDSGPISILVNNKNKQAILKDRIKGIAYNGPIVVLINGNSASASEFFTAAMQDYNRAIVVGSKSLGKATMQTIIPLDKNQQEFVKLTVEKFFRITGDSNQIKGIIPDIALPVLYDSIIPRESSYKTALKHTAIETKVRYQPFPKNYITKTIELGNLRAKNNPVFKVIKAANQEINTLYSETKKPLPLQFENVFADTNQMYSLWKKVKKIATTQNDVKITSNSYDLERLKIDPYQQEITNSKIKDLQSNPYLEAAISILSDFNTNNSD